MSRRSRTRAHMCECWRVVPQRHSHSSCQTHEACSGKRTKVSAWSGQCVCVTVPQRWHAVTTDAVLRPTSRVPHVDRSNVRGLVTNKTPAAAPLQQSCPLHPSTRSRCSARSLKRLTGTLHRRDAAREHTQRQKRAFPSKATELVLQIALALKTPRVSQAVSAVSASPRTVS